MVAKPIEMVCEVTPNQLSCVLHQNDIGTERHGKLGRAAHQAVPAIVTQVILGVCARKTCARWAGRQNGDLLPFRQLQLRTHLFGWDLRKVAPHRGDADVTGVVPLH